MAHTMVDPTQGTLKNIERMYDNSLLDGGKEVSATFDAGLPSQITIKLSSDEGDRAPTVIEHKKKVVNHRFKINHGR